MLNEIEEDRIANLIGQNFSFQGDANFSSPLIVKGSLDGKINLDSNIYFTSTAKVDADIVCNTIESKGILKGNIISCDTIKLLKDSINNLTIKCNNLIVEKGAKFNGSCLMEEEDSKQNNESL